jgi:hypothetical protein
MKNIIFFVAAIVFLMASCSTSKNLSLPSDVYGKDYTDSPENYLHHKSYVPEDTAKLMIRQFRTHKHWLFGKKKLDSAWSKFDLGLIRIIAADPHVDSVKFFPAAIIKKGEFYNYPFTLMQVSMTVIDSTNGVAKGGNESEFKEIQIKQYFSPVGMCPPPTNDCRL